MPPGALVYAKPMVFWFDTTELKQNETDEIKLNEKYIIFLP